MTDDIESTTNYSWA